MGNKGSSVVEMSLIMPIIFGIVVMVIVLFLDTIRDGLVQQEGYSVIYTYQEVFSLLEIKKRNFLLLLNVLLLLTEHLPR